MKVFACVLALCMIAAVYCQRPAAAQAAPAAMGGMGMGMGGNPLVGGARAGGMGSLNNLFTMGALTGGLGNDAFGRFAMCNMMMQGQSSLLCMTSLMQ